MKIFRRTHFRHLEVVHHLGGLLILIDTCLRARAFVRKIFNVTCYCYDNLFIFVGVLVDIALILVSTGKETFGLIPIVSVDDHQLVFEVLAPHRISPNIVDSKFFLVEIELLHLRLRIIEVVLEELLFQVGGAVVIVVGVEVVVRDLGVEPICISHSLLILYDR